MADTKKSPKSKLGLWGEIMRNLGLVWRLLNDPRVPLLNKLVIPGLFLLYLLWPADLWPDLFPLVGQVDDLVLLALALKLFIDLSPAEVVRQYREGKSYGNPGKQRGGMAEEVIEAEYRIVE
ncbi:MAG: YkvA family protein [Anaerolineae bacterium]